MSATTTISHDEIAHLAQLSALQLTSEEIERLGKDVEGIVAYVGQLAEIDTTGVEPLLHPIPGVTTPLQHDVSPYADPDSLLDNVQHQINHRHIMITTK